MNVHMNIKFTLFAEMLATCDLGTMDITVPIATHTNT